MYKFKIYGKVPKDNYYSYYAHFKLGQIFWSDSHWFIGQILVLDSKFEYVLF